MLAKEGINGKERYFLTPFLNGFLILVECYFLRGQINEPSSLKHASLTRFLECMNETIFCKTQKLRGILFSRYSSKSKILFQEIIVQETTLCSFLFEINIFLRESNEYGKKIQKYYCVSKTSIFAHGDLNPDFPDLHKTKTKINIIHGNTKNFRNSPVAQR